MYLFAQKKERLLKKQHRQALLLDNFLVVDGIGPGRSLRDRKPVTYTFGKIKKFNSIVTGASIDIVLVFGTWLLMPMLWNDVLLFISWSLAFHSPALFTCTSITVSYVLFDNTNFNDSVVGVFGYW